MTTEQRLDYVRRQLAVWRDLERKACDEIDWIALKLSCHRDESERLIERATKPAAEPCERPLLDELAAALADLFFEASGSVPPSASTISHARAALARYDAARQQPVESST